MSAAVLDTARYRLDVAGTIIPATEWQAASQAQDLIERANAALAEARSQSENVRREAHAQGFEQGRQAALDAFANALHALTDARAALQTAMQERVTQLAVAVVERIAPNLGAQQVLPALAQEAVQQLLGEPALLVRVHPQVAQAVRARLSALGGLPDLEVLGDAALDEFDCVIETQGGAVHAGLPQQLRQIEGILASAQAERAESAS